MENSEYHLDFKKLCKKVNIGQLINPPAEVSGGLLHRMYKIQTDKGLYAVKALNPQIMKRETAMPNYIFSEKVANIAFKNGIHALPAIVAGGSFMHEVEGQYYMLFEWFYGKALSSTAIDSDKCRIIGGELAKIHQLDFSEMIIPNQETAAFVPVDWNHYAIRGTKDDLAWADLFSEQIENLGMFEKLANDSATRLHGNTVISHRDLDKKNVLWDTNHSPMIIDWEAAGLINPAQELVDVALYWAETETNSINKEAFYTVIHSYILNGGTIKEKWTDALQGGLKGKLEWLEYNMKRSLGDECSDDTERELGTGETIKTIQSLLAYRKIMTRCEGWLLELS